MSAPLIASGHVDLIIRQQIDEFVFQEATAVEPVQVKVKVSIRLPRRIQATYGCSSIV